MTATPTTIDLDEVVKVLTSLGIDEASAREQFAAAADDEELAEDVAALAIESEAGLLLPLDSELDGALFELVDGLRQVGVVISLGQTASAAALVLGAGARVLEVHFADDASTDALVCAIAGVVPDTHQLLRVPGYEAGDALPLVIMDRGSYTWLRAAAADGQLDAALVPVQTGEKGVTLTPVAADRLLVPDFAQRFIARSSEQSSTSNVEEVWQRVSRYDARVAWPEGHKRPPGDDLYELTAAIGGVPLARALASATPVELANVLYRFALLTTVGAHWDVLAARQNPGMSAQGVLGLGQLSWSWFIFEALGAQPEAARVASLLATDWVRVQERGSVTARQRAWFDLGELLRTGKRGPALGRIRELLPLIDRAAWKNPGQVAAALAVHTEPRGDQLTHQAIYYAWPAPLYALVARAGALDLLPAHDPFLSRALRVEAVEKKHEMVVWAEQQLARFDAMDETRLPPLLDPLPVIVDVLITEVDATQTHGRTLLAAHASAEHHVVAPHAGRSMRAGEIWLFEVSGSRPSRARTRYDDLGEVSYNIALPTGEWLHRVEPPA